jgi:hypothetical protein
MEDCKMKKIETIWNFTYDKCFDEFDTWEILGSGPIKFVHGNKYTVILEGETYFIIYGVLFGKNSGHYIDMTLNGWACDIQYLERIELLNPDKKWISLDAL